MRTTFAVFVWAIFPALFLFGGILLWGPTQGLFTGAGISLIFIGVTLYYLFLLDTPALELALIANPLWKDSSGNASLRGQGSGLSLKFPQEYVVRFVSAITRRTPVALTYTAKDGPKIETRGAFLWDIDDLTKFVSIKEEDLIATLGDRAGNFVNDWVSERTARGIRTSKHEFDEAVEHYFSLAYNTTPEERKGSAVMSMIQGEFGIRFKPRGVVMDPDYTQRYQHSLETQQVMVELQDAAYRIMGVPEEARKGKKLPVDDDVMDDVLFIHTGGTVERHTQKIHGKGVEALGALFMAGMKAAGGRGSEREENQRSPAKKPRKGRGKSDDA